MLFFGIDPGADGAVAVLDHDGGLLAAFDMPSVDVEVSGKLRRRLSAPLLAELIREWRGGARCHATIERVGAMPGQGTASMFSFGKSAGIPEGVLAGIGIPYGMVSPVTWKRAANLAKDKGAARMMAMNMWPSFAKLFARVKDDGRAEAALIARWGWLAFRADDGLPHDLNVPGQKQ